MSMDKITEIIGPDALAALEAAGYAVVPKEPTKAMLDSARDWSYAVYGKPIGNAAANGCWAAMIQDSKGE
jgi:hypothetical protein